MSNYIPSGTNPHQSYQSFNTQTNVSSSSNQNTSIDSTSYRGQQGNMPAFLSNQKNNNTGIKQGANLPVQAQQTVQNSNTQSQSSQSKPVSMATYLQRPGQTLTNPNTASWRKN